MPIAATRSLLAAALSGGLDSVEYRTDPVFGFEVPVERAGRGLVAARPPADLARPRRVRPQGSRLAGMFRDNFARFAESAGAAVAAAGPCLDSPPSASPLARG